jgi:hypothetical protein
MGFRTGSEKREKLFHRARELGHNDGKTGQKTHREEIVNWPETKQVIQEGAYAPTLFSDLYAAYDEGYGPAA